MPLVPTVASRRKLSATLATGGRNERPEEIVIRSRRPLSSTGKRKSRITRADDEND